MEDYKKHKASKILTKEQEKEDEGLGKKIIDLFSQTSNQEFYKKFQTLMLDYVKPTYKDLSLINENISFVGNINDERIKKFKVINQIYNYIDCKRYVPENYFDKITIKETDPMKEKLLSFWLQTNQKVERKQILGFPLCIYTNRTFLSLFDNKNNKENSMYSLFFMKNPSKSTTSFFTEVQKAQYFPSEIFQKIFIFYHLYQHGLVSQNYLYHEMESKQPVKMTFKIMDLLFSVEFKTLITLSPKTHLVYNERVRPTDYFNSLDNNELKSLANTNYESFPEFLMGNFFQFFQKNIYNHKNLNSLAEILPTITCPQIGRLYIVRKGDNRNVLYCILLNRNTTHATLLFLFDSTLANTFSMSTQTYSIQELSGFVFYKPNFIFEDFGSKYFIGERY